MAAYKLQGKTANGDMVDIPLAATYDAAGHDIEQHYAAKTEYEAIMSKLGTMDGKLDALVGLSKDSSFAGASWSTIKTLSEAGLASVVWSVGDEKEVTLTTGEKITLVILGFNHDNLAGGSGKAGITLGTKNALATTYMMNSNGSNTGGWAGCQMRTSTMETLYGLLPDEVKSIIKTVNKITGRYDLSPRGTLETTEDKLFLFSQEEVMGTHYMSTTGQNSFPGEGAQYEYFKRASIPAPTSGTGSFAVLEGTGCFYTTDTAVASGYNNKFGQAKTTTANRYYNFNNAKAQGDNATTACYWWLRSPYYYNSYSFCCVNNAGYSDYNSANYSIGVAFGFCV